MLLYRKPLEEVQVGESFQVTVTAQDWQEAVALRDVVPADARDIPERCPVALALGRTKGVQASVGCFYAKQFDQLEPLFTHTGSHIVRCFDGSAAFPGETVVTFTREV